MASTNSPSQAPINQREVTTATVKEGLRKTAQNTFKTLRHQHIDERRGITTEESFEETFEKYFEKYLECDRDNPATALRQAYKDYMMDWDNCSSNWEMNWILHDARKEMLEQEYCID